MLIACIGFDKERRENNILKIDLSKISSSRRLIESLIYFLIKLSIRLKSFKIPVNFQSSQATQRQKISPKI
jgi:hypothetical protein